MEELRLQFFLFFLNYWRLYQNRGVDMGDVMRAIYESMPPIPVCANEDCDWILFGYNWDAVHCSHECYDKDPVRKAFVKERRNTPKYKISRKRNSMKYRQSPKGKAYQKDYGKAFRESPEGKAYIKEYRQSEAGKASNKKSTAKYQGTAKGKAAIARGIKKNQTPEGRVAYNRSKRELRARKKAERLAAEEQTSP